MMTSILTGWQQAISNKYRRSSKILTKTTFKALFSTQIHPLYLLSDMAASFKLRKAAVKKAEMKRSLADDEKLFKIKAFLKTQDMTEDLIEQIKRMTDERGDLSPTYVETQLRSLKRNNVLIYHRNTARLLYTDVDASGFVIYTVSVEERKIVCEIIALLSIDGRRKIQPILSDGTDPKGCGEVALRDLEEFIKQLLKSESEYDGKEEAEIKLESLKKAFNFYLKNGFEEYKTKPSGPGLIPMRKIISLEQAKSDLYHVPSN